MIYTIIMNNRSYELPKKTVDVMEALDGALTIDNNRNMSLREKYACLHEFVKKMIGDGKAKECLGSESLDELDLSELAIVVQKIHDAYEKPVNDYRMSKMRDKISGIPMDKIASMMSMAENVKND